jgi:putative transposase
MIYGHFRPLQHLMTTDQYRHARNKAFWIWQQETCVQASV